MEITVNGTCCILSPRETPAIITIIIKFGCDLPPLTPARTLGQSISRSDDGCRGLLPTVSPASLRRHVWRFHGGVSSPHPVWVSIPLGPRTDRAAGEGCVGSGYGPSLRAGGHSANPALSLPDGDLGQVKTPI